MSAYSFLNHIEAFGSKVLFKRAQTELTYNQFAKQVEKKRLTYKKIGLAHKVIALKIENTEDALSSFLALASIQSIIVPFYKSVPDNITVVIEATIEINSEITFNESTIADECINELRKTNSSGLIISTSGTSGSPKWIVHRFDSLLSKYIHLQKPIIVPLVYQLDNISGIETFTSVACGGGTLICLPSNTPQQFAHNLKTVDLAPNVLSVTPSFLKLVILANGHKLLPGINRVNLGGEKLTRQDLELFQKGFSKAQIFSFYGTSETSSIKTETKPESNLINWGKNGVDFKVVNGILHLKSNSVTLIGQLFKGLQKGNWIKTDDIVEEKEKGFYEVRGRENDQVIVAGKRVLLTDIKSVILTIKGVEACHVFSKPNSIIGNIIAAEVVANNHVTVPQIRKYCMNNLDDYKVPTEIKLIDNWWVNHRLKSDF